MKTTGRFLILIVIIAGLFTANSDLFSQQNAGQLFEKALYMEEAKGDLKGAIDIYNQIVENNNADPSIQAKALLHLGMCYENLGMKEATRAYQRLVSNFPEQKNEVGIARERLSKLTKDISSDEIIIKHIWAVRGIAKSGGVSVDGAYFSLSDETGNLVLRNLHDGETNQLTSDATMKRPVQGVYASLPSENASKIVYVWYNDEGKPGYYQLRLIKPGEDIPVVLHSFDKNVQYVDIESWFSNDNKILFQTYNSNDQLQISAIDVNSKEVNQLLKKTQKRSGTAGWKPNIEMSPDEKYIVYDFPDSTDNGKYDVYRMQIDSKIESPLIKHPGNDWLIGWFHGRNELLFMSDRAGTIDIWAVTVYSGKSSLEPRQIFTNIGNIIPMQLTKKGTLYYRTSSRLMETAIIPFNGTDIKLSDSRQVTIQNVADVHWLPDGEYLVGRPMVRYQKLMIYNIKSGDNHSLTDNIIPGTGLPRVSPDGKSVLILGADNQKSDNGERIFPGIYSIDIATGKSDEITVKHAADKIHPIITDNCVEWDKDGKNIFYVYDHKIIKHNILTGEEKVIYTDNNEYFHPNLRRSIDGKYLFFTGGKKTGQIETPLLRIPQDGGEVKNLCTINMGCDTFVDKNLCHSPDGRYIYYSESCVPPEQKSILFRIPSEGGTPEKVWEPEDYRIIGLSIHPDNKQIAISISALKTEIYAMENLGKKVAEVFSENK